MEKWEGGSCKPQYTEQVGGPAGIGAISGASASNYIRFQPAPGASPTISGGSSIIHINGGAHIECWGMTITNWAGSYGVHIEGDASDSIVIKNCTIVDNEAGKMGILISDGDNCVIQGNSIDCAEGMTVSYGAENNQIHGNEIFSDSYGSGGSAIMLSYSVKSNVFSNNEIHGFVYGVSWGTSGHPDQNALCDAGELADSVWRGHQQHLEDPELRLYYGPPHQLLLMVHRRGNGGRRLPVPVRHRR